MIGMKIKTSRAMERPYGLSVRKPQPGKVSTVLPSAPYKRIS
jgi:hypothetical protein